MVGMTDEMKGRKKEKKREKRKPLKLEVKFLVPSEELL